MARYHIVYQAEKYGVVRLETTSQVIFVNDPPTPSDIFAVENALKERERLDDVKLLYWTPLADEPQPDIFEDSAELSEE